MGKNVAFHFLIFGIVQGVGFRPFVDNLAHEHDIVGSVANRGSFVEIFAKGAAGDMDDFMREIRTRAPERSIILKIEAKKISPDDVACDDFSIIESEREAGDIFVSPDIATCEKCRSELYDESNRRYLHPFINCTSCGPRLTILDAMPYDRERTSMGAFPMCDACADEYHNPASRRYDAQPVCCNECGPTVRILDGDETGSDAIKRVRRVIADGGIAAVKGIGGFHLVCDATNEKAVAELRRRKHRPTKPFAVMARDIDAAECEAEVPTSARAILCGHQRPIVLLKKRDGGNIVSGVAPYNSKVGIMLPYAPIHYLLFDYPIDDTKMPDVLVMTSGNPSGAPICRTDDDAREALGSIADVIMTHNRRIRVRADDTVMDFYDDEPYMIRRSRGYAPLPVMMSASREKCVLAIGGELKNTFCLAKNGLYYPSSYIGDLSDVRTVAALKETVERMMTLLEMRPDVIACDMHPRYQSSRVAREMASRLGVPVIEVQHHYAHILSCMAENDVAADKEVIGVAMDGTGYGTDGTIWGGELMRASYHGFRRLGSITPFHWAGGDRASREGWRIAANMIYDLMHGDKKRTHEICDALHLATETQVDAQMFMEDNHINCVTSTSAGRLFDAVSAVLGICRASSFEGEAAMRLQYAAECAQSVQRECESKRSDLSDENELTTKFEDKAKRLAYFFHDEFAKIIAESATRAAEKEGLDTVALSGGVFQNTLLLSMAEKRLKKAGLIVLRHHLIPPNDGGICLGQAVAAMMQ